MTDIMADLAARERADQLRRFPPLQNEQEKVAVLRPDLVQIEQRDEFRRDIFWLVFGALAAFWLCVGIGVAQQWDTISAAFRGWFA